MLKIDIRIRPFLDSLFRIKYHINIVRLFYFINLRFSPRAIAGTINNPNGADRACARFARSIETRWPIDITGPRA